MKHELKVEENKERPKSYKIVPTRFAKKLRQNRRVYLFVDGDSRRNWKCCLQSHETLELLKDVICWLELKCCKRNIYFSLFPVRRDKVVRVLLTNLPRGLISTYQVFEIWILFKTFSLGFVQFDGWFLGYPEPSSENLWAGPPSMVTDSCKFTLKWFILYFLLTYFKNEKWKKKINGNYFCIKKRIN